MSFDTFRAEKATIAHGEAVLADGRGGVAREEYGTLLAEYEKLFKVTRRLVRMSDRSEEGLKQANQRIREQQEELAAAHRALASHAEVLEERVRERTKELVAAQAKLERLVELGIALSRERSPVRFMDMILKGAKELTHADGGLLLSRADDDRLRHEILWFDSLDLRQGGQADHEVSEPDVPLRAGDGALPNYFHPIAHAALTGRTVNVANLAENQEYDFASVRAFDETHGYTTQSLLAVPLTPRRGEVSGVVVLINARPPGTGRITGFSPEIEGFVEALASQAAIARDNQSLLAAQEQLFDAIIKVIAGAIDVKSPYTHGHCLRVPELAQLIARAACTSTDGPFDGFEMTDDEWREFYLAGWLHDCGKVTTPEYVVDKATKLETIWNRIHEVRTRFEVVRRDLVIADLEARLAGAVDDPAAADAALAGRIDALHDDFAFVAGLNDGSVQLTPEARARLDRIAEITWQRRFDDRLGLSIAELDRLHCLPARPTPATEPLLADRPEHLIPHRGGEVSYDPDRYGFKITIPRHLFNLGEVYNLSIGRGTLTDEERFKINEHIIQTIIMLEALPFPRTMARVPEIAGAHHETMTGTGYPRRLTRDDMSVQARILAVSDIFEALTASDRPYKSAKTLSQSIAIMSRMRDDQHIDADIFDLFLVSGIYLTYARRFLKPEQIDTVEVRLHLSTDWAIAALDAAPTMTSTAA